jgi:hypothetical protein
MNSTVAPFDFYPIAQEARHRQTCACWLENSEMQYLSRLELLAMWSLTYRHLTGAAHVAAGLAGLPKAMAQETEETSGVTVMRVSPV